MMTMADVDQAVKDRARQLGQEHLRVILYRQEGRIFAYRIEDAVPMLSSDAPENATRTIDYLDCEALLEAGGW